MKENEEDEILEELEEGEVFIEELDDEETEETTGGGWRPTETWDFSRLTKTHYLYITETAPDRLRIVNEKLLNRLGKRKVRVGEVERRGALDDIRKSLRGAPLIHVDIVGVR